MNTPSEIKNAVKEKYSEIAASSTGCCGSGCGCSPVDIDYTIMKDDYENMDGYLKEADLGLGCGLPTEYAAIKPGDTVVDLGSGAGNDVFVARAITGNSGRVIGIDFTEEMIKKANANKAKVNAENVGFKLGEIENLPLEDNSADVIVSNCVLNLVPDKPKAFSEIYRVLKTGAHFCVSDIVVKGQLPDQLRKSAELYAGCVSGAVDESDYLKIIKDAGFKNIEVKKSKTINLPESLLLKHLSSKEVSEFYNQSGGIFSITVVGYK